MQGQLAPQAQPALQVPIPRFLDLQVQQAPLALLAPQDRQAPEGDLRLTFRCSPGTGIGPCPQGLRWFRSSALVGEAVGEVERVRPELQARQEAELEAEVGQESAPCSMPQIFPREPLL